MFSSIFPLVLALPTILMMATTTTAAPSVTVVPPGGVVTFIPGGTYHGMEPPCLNADSNSPNSQVDVKACSPGLTKQEWTIVAGTGIPGIITIFNGDQCLDVPGGNTADGTPVQIQPCTSEWNQQFEIGTDATIKWIANYNKCVTYENGSVVIDECNGATNQQWYPQLVSK